MCQIQKLVELNYLAIRLGEAKEKGGKLVRNVFIKIVARLIKVLYST